MLCEMFFFSSEICLKAIFYIAQKFFILTKNLHTARTPTEMKQNLLHLIFPRQYFR